jgi:mono/diheme cytochrome c family protein
LTRAALLGALAAALAACGRPPEDPGLEILPDMADPIAYPTGSVSGNTRTSRDPAPGSMPRTFSPLHFREGPEEAARAARELSNPLPASPENLSRGRARFQVFCAGCHGVGGLSDGPLVPWYPSPPSLVAKRARSLPDGQIVHIVSFGQGLMPGHAGQIPLEDRWRIALHVRRLQAGTGMEVDDGVPRDPAGGWSQIDNKVCGTCHPRHLAEYQTARMSQAATDPLFLAVLERYSFDFQGRLSPVCIRCHSPSASLRGRITLQDDADARGLSCAFCHSIIRLRLKVGQRSLGVHSFDLGDGRTFRAAPPPPSFEPFPLGPPKGTTLPPAPALDRPRDAPPENRAHGTGTDPLFGDSRLCYGCHGINPNTHGLVVCTTWSEYERYLELSGSRKTCQDCHMPPSRGRISALSLEERVVHSHSFHGADPEELMRNGVKLGVTVSFAARGALPVEVSLENLAGHGFPTGIPDKHLVLHARALDAAGATVWTYQPDRPGDELLRVVWEGTDGRIGVPGQFAMRRVSDTRLQPAETRRVSLTIPEDVARRVEAVVVELGFRNFYENRTRQLKMKSDYWLKEHTIATARAAREEEIDHGHR